MTLTVEIDPARRTAEFREVSYLAAGDRCSVVLDGVRGADAATLSLALYRDAASESPVASCASFSAVPGHPRLASGDLALDTFEMAAWFGDAVPEESDDSDDAALPLASASAEPRLAARASLAERSVRTDGWLVVADVRRVWAACRVPVLLRPGAGTSGAADPVSVAALVEALVGAAMEEAAGAAVAAAAASKADKVPSASAGNLASLDASGNLADSGATPASIKAAAVAEVVANAPGTMDTLKEIADILGSSQQSGTVLKRIADLESAEVPVDATLSRAGEAADAKTVGDALRSGFTEWEFSGSGYDPSTTHIVTIDEYDLGGETVYIASLDGEETVEVDSLDVTSITFINSNITATRHLVTPTKTSQLTNDGDGTNAFVKTNDTRLSDARTPTAHHATHAANGSDPIAPADIGAASASDLPYRLVEPGEWGEVIGLPEGVSASVEYFDDTWYFSVASEEYAGTLSSDGLALTANVPYEGSTYNISATRPSLPGHLLDRAVNAVSDEADLVLPPLEDQGKSRDLLVRMTLTAATAVTVSASTGETVTWDSAGSPSDTYEAGTYLFRFTEVSQPSSTASVFHFADLGDGGSIDPAVLNGKLEATSAAPAFDSTKTYSVGEHVTYGGVLYECTTAVTTAGAWTGSTNWTATDMTSPDATLDLMADGRLRLVSADGEVLWMQGYDLAPTSSVALSCDKVNFYAFASGTVTQAFDMPSAPSGKVGDFVLDVDNTANASASATATLTGAGTSFDVFTPEGVNLSTDVLTFAGGERCELYFTMTAFGTAAKPAWKVVKQVVEKQEFGS